MYRTLLDAESVQQWMVPEGMTSHVHAFDAHEGGTFRISLSYDMPSTAGKTSAQTDSFHGRFAELVPDAKVVQVVEFETDDPELQGKAELHFDPTGLRCTMDIPLEAAVPAQIPAGEWD